MTEGYHRILPHPPSPLATGLTHIVADVVMNLLQKVNGYINSHPVPEDKESLESRGDIASATDQPDTTR